MPPFGRLLSRLAGNGPALSDDERSLVEGCSLGLDLDGGFDRYAAWIAHNAFDLPLADDVVDVRAFEVPDTIPVMAMRSLIGAQRVRRRKTPLSAPPRYLSSDEWDSY